MSTNLTPKEDLIPDGDRGQMRIRLTDQEAAICDVLDKVSKYVEETTGTKVELRVAGGWVRDKVCLLILSAAGISINEVRWLPYVSFNSRLIFFFSSAPLGPYQMFVVARTLQPRLGYRH